MSFSFSSFSSLSKEGKEGSEEKESKKKKREKKETWKKEFVKLTEVPNITLRDELILQLKYNYDSYTKPVFIRYYETGRTARVEYQAHNNRHKLDGPVKTSYYENGRLCCETFHVVNKKTGDTTFSIYYGYGSQISSVVCDIDGKVDVLSSPGLLSYFKKWSIRLRRQYQSGSK